MKLSIIKRDSRVKDFDMERIHIAIKKAYEEVHGNDIMFKNHWNDLETSIEKTILELGKEKIFIEEIQDTIVKALNDKDEMVAKAYEDYREKRRIARDTNGDTYKKLDKVLQCSDIMNSNANVDEHSFGGRKFESANVILKRYTLDKVIRPEIAKAHIENRIYLHDLDSYATGMHNCSFPDIKKLVNNGFTTRNGDVRGANGLSTAFQLVAVIFQIQSQEQFGGTGSCHIDYDLEEQVDISFRKHFSDALFYFEDKEVRWRDLDAEVCVENKERLKEKYPKLTAFALRELDREGMQSAQGLYHNLNTLESRPGSQVPFTSINLGRRTTVAGRLLARWLMLASIDGIGKHHKTSIFPISIFQYKKGINDVEGTSNYDLKKLAIESMSKRIYPNWVNCDWSKNVEDLSNPDTAMATMGCRTLVGFDRHGMGYSKVGRGNVTPVTINLVKIGIRHGICLGERAEADIEGFWKELNDLLELSATALVDRFKYICSQSAKSAPFMYKNKSMLGGEYESETCIYDVMKHGSQAIGYAGIAEMCQALFGKDHSDNKEVHKFALSVVERISKFAEEASERYDLNFGCYAAPIESTCGTIVTGNREIKGLRDEFGIIKNVTDREWITNSHHIPVWKDVDVFTKLQLEAPFTKYPTSGCITYVELDSSVVENPKAIEQIIDYAFSLDIPYLAFNFPIDTCLKCGYQAEFNDRCPVCGSEEIEQLRRVTGYLTTDYRNFNKAKQAEVKERFKHSTITKL
ncbi:anaerobic ribonucleoside-triphosphate reductase [Clostridium sp. UBA1056]|uniref:anaerobic ribonucleoside-triphosphate reductase n=1 Tax=unclassified Clostridium TaxID=2614128 RepID=UPI003216237A